MNLKSVISEGRAAAIVTDPTPAELRAAALRYEVNSTGTPDTLHILSWVEDEDWPERSLYIIDRPLVGFEPKAAMAHLRALTTQALAELYALARRGQENPIS